MPPPSTVAIAARMVSASALTQMKRVADAAIEDRRKTGPRPVPDLLDLLLGDPPRWPHPVRLLGRVCQYWEKTFYARKVLAGGGS